MIGGWELLLVFLLLLLLFGASYLPKFARSLGRTRKAFRDGMDEFRADSIDDSNPKENADSISER